MNFVAELITYLEALSLKIPVLLFIFIGGILEEIVAPIPSPVVMALSGTILNTQGKGLLFLLLAALVGAVAKTLGCWFWYFLADKGEDFVLGKIGKYIGFTHKELEGVGKHFKNTDKDFLIIAVTRAIPIVPTTPISVIAGIFKLDLKKYLAASFVGNFIRNSMFLYIGYVGHGAYTELLTGLDSAESIVQILIGVLMLGFFGIIYLKRNKSSDPIQNFLGKFLKK